MKHGSKLVGALMLVAAATAVLTVGPSATDSAVAPLPVAMPEQTSPRFAQTYGKLPLNFEVNRGQADPEVKFLSRGNGYLLLLTSREAVLALRDSDEQPAALDQRGAAPSSAAAEDRPVPEQAVLRMKFVGANPEPQVAGLEKLSAKSNYFIGNDPEKWRTNIPNYAKVRYEDIYPGIDLIYYGNQGQLEYDT